MTLYDRITRLEQRVSQSGESHPPGIPAAWLERWPDGEYAGPAPGDEPTPEQLRTFGELAAMDATVPIHELENET